MKYKTYKCNSFNVYTIKTDKFKTAHMEIVFRKKAIKEELCSYAFLTDMLTYSCKKYPQKRDLIIKLEELYRTSIYATTTKTGNILNTNFILDFINPEYINDEAYLEEVMRLPFELILNPNVINDEFDLKQFNLIKERLKRDIESIKENPTKECIREAINLMGGDTATTYKLLGDLEDLEKITPSNLYKLYKKLMKDNTCDIFIIGNLDMDEVVRLIKKYFKNRYINELNTEMLALNKPVKKEKVGTKESENVQANLVMIFNTIDLTKMERDITFQAFNYLFGSGGITCKLYQALREKNSLCYGVSSMYLKHDGLLLVNVSLEQANVKKAINLIKKELKAMQSGNFSLDELEDAKKNMIVSLDFALDNNISILNNYVFNIYADLPLIEERKELYKNITKEDIINVSKKIKINTTFTLKGKGEN